MANYKMARPGHSFVDGPINIAWGANAEASDVQSVPPAMQTPGFKGRVLAGLIVETKDKVTVNPTQPVDVNGRTYRLMTGEEAAAHKAIPPEPVSRRIWDPAQRAIVDVPMASPKILAEALVAAEQADAAVTGEDPGDISSVTPVAEDEPEAVEPEKPTKAKAKA